MLIDGCLALIAAVALVADAIATHRRRARRRREGRA